MRNTYTLWFLVHIYIYIYIYIYTRYILYICIYIYICTYIYKYICVCACVCACVRVFGVNCFIKLGQPGRIFFITFFISFFSILRGYGKLKQNLVKFLTILKSLTKKLNHLDHIKWHRNCANLLTF